MINFKNKNDREAILEALHSNMNEEFRATLQYICHRISAKEQDPTLAESFKSAALDEMSHILYFSDLISTYGGKIAFKQWPVDQSSELQKMLEQDIALEKHAKKRYAAQLERFKDYAEFTTIIESVLIDEEDHEEMFLEYLKRRFNR
jgi:bacterioferritin (cytochrome b1)